MSEINVDVSALETAKSGLEQFRTDINFASDKLGNHAQPLIEEVRQSIEKQRLRVEGIKKTLESLQKKLAEIDQNIIRCDKQINEFQQEIVRTREEINVVNSNISNLERKRSQLLRRQSDSEDNSSEIRFIENQIQMNITRQNALRNKSTSLEASLSAANKAKNELRVRKHQTETSIIEQKKILAKETERLLNMEKSGSRIISHVEELEMEMKKYNRQSNDQASSGINELEKSIMCIEDYLSTSI